MSEKKGVDGTPIDTVLYTREDPKAAERTKAELEVEDPKPEKAIGVIVGKGEGEAETDAR